MTGIVCALAGQVVAAGGGAAFSVPTAEFTDDLNTALLLHFNGTNGATTTTDDNSSGRTAKTITMANGAALNTGTKKFGTASVIFDGSGTDVVYTADSDDWNLALSTKTFEAWMYIDNLATVSRNSPNHVPKLMGHMNQGGTIYWCFGPNTEGGLTLFYYDGGSRWTHSTTKDITTGQWYHFALIIANNTAKGYVNGVEYLSKTFTANPSAGNVDFTIGSEFGTCFDGFVDEFRVSYGNRYTSDRTAKYIETIGNAQVDTAQSKFGGASMLTDGSNDALKSSGFNLTGDWTFEGWYRINSVTAEAILFRIHNSSNTFQANYGLLNGVTYTFQGGTTTGTTTLSTNTWYHLAYVRSGSTVSFYVNGSREATRTYSSPPNDAILYISGTADAANLSLNGWSDEIRISNSARYSGTTYTVPTAAFENDSNTLLLVHCNGIDASTKFSDDNS